MEPSPAETSISLFTETTHPAWQALQQRLPMSTAGMSPVSAVDITKV
jgi:hypothetical protein